MAPVPTMKRASSVQRTARRLCFLFAIDGNWGSVSGAAVWRSDSVGDWLMVAVGLKVFGCLAWAADTPAGQGPARGQTKTPPKGHAKSLAENHAAAIADVGGTDRKSTRLNSSHRCISYAV